MAEQESHAMYEIVTFKDTSDPMGKPVADIIPSIWVQKFGEGYVCFYPPAPYKNVQNFVKHQTKPSSSWQKFDIERHGTAGSFTYTYKKGCERLERFLRKLTVHTTEDENEQSSRCQTLVHNLNDVPEFPNISPPEDSRKDVHFFNRLQKESPSTLFDSVRQSVEEIPVVKKGKSSKRPIISSESDSNESERPLPRKQKKYATGSIQHSSTNKRIVVSDSEYETPKKIHNIYRLNAETRPKVAEVSRSDIFRAERKESRGEESDIKCLKTEVYDMKRSIMHEIRKLRSSVNECLSTIQNFIRIQGGELAVGKIADFEVGTKLSFPCKNESDFILFNDFLKDKENFEKFMHVLRDLFITPNEKWSINKSITVILQRYICKEVAKEYSAKGRSKLKKKILARPFFLKL